jgi:hypothetical protein
MIGAILSAARRARPSRTARYGGKVWLIVTGFGVALAACDHPKRAGEAGAAGPVNAARAPFLPGHIGASIDTPEGRREAHALLVHDGAFRMHVHGVGRATLDPTGSLELVGSLAMNGSHASGSGVAIGAGCGLPGPNRFCAETATWDVTLDMKGAFVDNGAVGELVVTSATGVEHWPIETGYWGGRPGFGPEFSVNGLYRERLAEFAQADDVLIDVGSDGRFFFQSAHSGCIGNGLMRPYRDALGLTHGNVYIVELALDGCAAPWSHLNRKFEGLATNEDWTPWDYSSSLHKMWLSTLPDVSPAAALMLVAEWVQ